jgi:putative spermidine/putrescine transport system permease protein
MKDNPMKDNPMKRGRLSGFERAYLFVVALAVLGPFVPLFIASFSFRWTWPNLLPTQWWWQARQSARLPQGWDYIFSEVSRLGEATFNTVVIALCVTLLCLLISLPAARVLAYETFSGKRGLEFFLLTPLIVPDIAVGLGTLIIFNHVGLSGSYAALVLAHLVPTLPYMLRVLTAVFQRLSRDYKEQALVDGASSLQAFWYVTLPMISSGVMAGSLFTFLISSNLFLLTFFVGRGQIDTLATLLFATVRSGGALDASSAGIALIAALPGVILLLVMEWFIKEEIFI